MTRIKQKKITDTWKRIPKHETRKMLAEEGKRKRFEAQLNIWKKRRKAEKNVKQEQDKNKKSLDTIGWKSWKNEE